MSSIDPQLRSLVTPEGAMILNIPADEMITLNTTGGYVWARLREGKAVDEIAADLASATGHDPTVVANDVRELIEQLKAMNVVSF